MEVQAMFWTIAGLAFVSVIILIGISLSGSLMKMQTCSDADLDDATSKDSIGAPCGEDLSGETVYCSYALITYGVRGTFREKDACINKEDSKCCGNCYEASGAYKDMGGVECGGLDATHLYYCLVTNNQGSDRCANADTHRCCRSNSPQSTGGAGGTSGGSETPGCDFELPGQIENPGSCPY